MSRVTRSFAFSLVAIALTACSSSPTGPIAPDYANPNYVNPNINYVNPNINYVNPNINYVNPNI